MFSHFRIVLISTLISTFSFADVFMTELADPQNESGSNHVRFVELYNNGTAAVDLSGWALQRWTNGGTDPQSPVSLTGTISAEGFYVICNDADDFAATYTGSVCNQDIGTGGPADSNGDDQIGLFNGDTLVDFFGDVGQDGNSPQGANWHEFEDGRAERAANVTAGCADTTGVACQAGWIVDNDSGGGDGNQYAPEGFDPGSWIGEPAPDPGDLCADVTCPAASGDCYVAGTCDSSTGTCSAETFADSGTSCDDGDDDSVGDSCDGSGMCSGTALTTSSYDWSNNGTVLGTYGNVSLAENVNGTLFLTEDPLAGTPYGIIATVTGLTGGEVVTACADFLAAEDSNDSAINNKGKLGFHYYQPSLGLDDYQGSGGQSAYAETPGTWVNLCHSRTVDSFVDVEGDCGGDTDADGYDDFNCPDGQNDKGGLIIEARLYTYGGSIALGVDNLTVSVTSGTVTFPEGEGCLDPAASNYDQDATIQTYNQYGTSTCEYSGCDAIPDNDLNSSGSQGCIYADGTSASWGDGADDGWWNCIEWGGSVCGLAEVVFQLDLPSDLSGLPHVNGTMYGDDWCGGNTCYNNMSDGDSDGIWEFVQYYAPGTFYEYKFTLNPTDGSPTMWEEPGADCSNNYTNREFTTGDINTSQTLASCWGSCDATCPLSCTDQGLVSCDIDGSCAATADACPQPVSGVIFDGTFGGTSMNVITGEYTNPAGSEPWAGFANLDTSIYPLSFPLGGQITFNASVSSTDVSVYFRLEDYPYQEGVAQEAYDLNPVTISGSDVASYSVDVPSYNIGFNSFLLYVQAGQTVTITDVAVLATGDPCAGVVCDSGSSCDSTGQCVVDPLPCDNVTCDPGSSCDASTGQCVVDPLPSTVTFNIDGLGDCDQVNIHGSWDYWSGWSAHPDVNMTVEIPAGDHEFVILCVDTDWVGVGTDENGNSYDIPWYDDVVSASVPYNAPIGGACWNGNNDYANYTLNVDGSGSAMTVSYCAGTCDATCPISSLVTFDIDGVGDCSFVSIHASFPDASGVVWSGWGAHTDSGMQATVPEGDWEYVILCADTSIEGWYNDIVVNSTSITAPLGSSCDADPNDEWANYGFTVDSSGSPMTVSVCAGTCDDSCSASNLFFSEHAEGSSNNKYFEVYNASSETVDLSDYAFVNCSNGCDDWEYTNSFADGASVGAGDVYVVCHTQSASASCSDPLYTNQTACEDNAGTWVLSDILAECDESRTLYHNGNDAQGLIHSPTDFETTVLDVFGAVGADPGENGWDVGGILDATKDRTLVRKNSVTSGNPLWFDNVNAETGSVEGYGSAGSDFASSEWYVFPQDTWDYIGSHPHSTLVSGCTASYASNYNANASVDDGSCQFTYVDVTFAVGMNFEPVAGDMQVRVLGEYDSWQVMDDSDGDLTFTKTLSLPLGGSFEYNFRNHYSYESGGAFDGDCGSGNYGNNRTVTVEDSDGDSAMDLDAVCWESCDVCPSVVPGCTDSTAVNYDPLANSDDGSCLTEWPTPDNIFFSEYAEGSSNNKYLEIYNATDGAVDLSWYSLSSCSNGCQVCVGADATNENACTSGGGVWTVTNDWDYPDNVSLGYSDGTTSLAVGDVFVVCHGSADPVIQAECDKTFTYLSNGDDVFALTQMGSGAVVDIIGTIGDDPGSGWAVAGVANATKDHTLVRKSTTTIGNGGQWEASAGADSSDSEWVVLDQNDWTYVGSHNSCDDNCSSWQSCGDLSGACECTDNGGNVNGLGDINVTDIVALVGWILGCSGDATCFTAEQVCNGDLNDDGDVNVIDVTALVNIILADRISYDDATSANIVLTNNTISVNSDGYVAGVQMTLSHGSNFSLDLEDSYVSEYSTIGNKTTLLLVATGNSLEEIATYKGSFEVESIVLCNSNDEIFDVNVINVNSVEVKLTGPNPFNPSTSLNIVVAQDGFVSVNVYNLVGQKVATLLNDYMDANLNGYPVNFNGSNLASGVYLVRAETAGNVSTQKLMLLK